MPEIAIDGAKLFYDVSGTGEPILLIPGLGLDHAYYRLGRPAAGAAHAGPRGRSPRHRPLDQIAAALHGRRLGRRLRPLIDRLGFGPIHVLGSSLGGSMALALAQRHPERVKSLIVVGGFSELDRATELNFRLRLRLIGKLGMSDEVADYMGLWTLTRKFINSDAGFAVMRANQANIRTNSAEFYSAFVEPLLRWGRLQPGQEQEPKFTTLLGTIKARTLVITSDNDQLIPKELSELIAARVPGAELFVMPGAGHIPFMEQPEGVVRIVLDFLDQQPR